MNTDITLDRLVEAMTRFASQTRDDRLSVGVARVATRLQNSGNAFERPLTPHEQRVINMFADRLRQESEVA